MLLQPSCPTGSILKQFHSIVFKLNHAERKWAAITIIWVHMHSLLKKDFQDSCVLTCLDSDLDKPTVKKHVCDKQGNLNRGWVPVVIMLY